MPKRAGRRTDAPLETLGSGLRAAGVVVMTPVRDPRPRGAYGIDAPYLLPIPTVLIAANILQGVLSRTVWPFLPTHLVTATKPVSAEDAKQDTGKRKDS